MVFRKGAESVIMAYTHPHTVPCFFVTLLIQHPLRFYDSPPQNRRFSLLNVQGLLDTRKDTLEKKVTTIVFVRKGLY